MLRERGFFLDEYIEENKCVESFVKQRKMLIGNNTYKCLLFLLGIISAEDLFYYGAFYQHIYNRSNNTCHRCNSYTKNEEYKQCCKDY